MSDSELTNEQLAEKCEVILSIGEMGYGERDALKELLTRFRKLSDQITRMQESAKRQRGDNQLDQREGIDY